MIDPNVQQILDTIVWPIIGAIGTALATWIAAKVATLLGLKSDAELKSVLEQAIKNGIQLAQAKVSTLKIADPSVQSQIIMDAADYVAANAPRTLKKLGVDVSTPHGNILLAKKIEARLAPAVLGSADHAQASVGAASTEAKKNEIAVPIVPITPIIPVKPPLSAPYGGE